MDKSNRLGWAELACRMTEDNALRNALYGGVALLRVRAPLALLLGGR